MRIIGREEEIGTLERALETGDRLLVIYGRSGVGKTRLIEEILNSHDLRSGARRKHFFSLYHESWAAFLAEASVRFKIPSASNSQEIEQAIVRYTDSHDALILLDNLEQQHVPDLVRFADQWLTSVDRGALIITCQNHVRDRLPQDWPAIHLHGLRGPETLRTMLGRASNLLDDGEVSAIGQLVEGNPQALLFLDWLGSSDKHRLFEMAHSIADQDASEAIDDILGRSGTPSLFFLSLGVHRDAIVELDLLATLWDHFASRGAAAFFREIRRLETHGFLLAAGARKFRVHEAVHVGLAKLLRRKIGDERLPSLHHYFAEFYRVAVLESGQPEDFSSFVYHATAAGSFSLLFEVLIDHSVARTVASQGSTYFVVDVLAKILPQIETHIRPEQFARYLINLGQLRNDLSEHTHALGEARRAVAVLGDDVDSVDSLSVERSVMYLRGVAYSNTGQSEQCRENYAGIVALSRGDGDALACLCLGYFAHDLKYSDLDLAATVGEVAVDWARTSVDSSTLSRNLCSVAETYSFLRLHGAALDAFAEADEYAGAAGDHRLLGRIAINEGFARVLAGDWVLGRSRIRHGVEIAASLGDRRRAAQGRVYDGVAAFVTGEPAEALSSLRMGSLQLAEIGDGRYFVLGCDLLRSLTTPDDLSQFEEIWEHSAAHPEFAVYRKFWSAQFEKGLRHVE